MAFGTQSRIFRQWVADELQGTITGRWSATDVFKVALFGNTGTPDATVASGLTAYNAASSAWLAANEVTDTNWAAGGRTLAGVTVTSTGSTLTFDATDTANGGSSVTLLNVYGDLLYDSSLATPVANQGAAFHSFGGVQSVTAGTFTVIWNAAGLMTVTV